jgi:hypothetical protein
MYFSAVAVKRVAERTAGRKKTGESDNAGKEEAIACFVSPQAIAMRRAAPRAQTAT